LSTTYASFNLFGLYFTYVTGVLIIVTSFILEPLLRFLHRRRKYNQYAYLEWSSNATLQLHRLAHEANDCSKWNGCTDFVPVSNDILARLDIEDLEHPILARQSADMEEKLIPNETSEGSSTEHITKNAPYHADNVPEPSPGSQTPIQGSNSPPLSWDDGGSSIYTRGTPSLSEDLVLDRSEHTHQPTFGVNPEMLVHSLTHTPDENVIVAARSKDQKEQSHGFEASTR
jgi:hypothetical protein